MQEAALDRESPDDKTVKARVDEVTRKLVSEKNLRPLVERYLGAERAQSVGADEVGDLVEALTLQREIAVSFEKLHRSEVRIARGEKSKERENYRREGFALLPLEDEKDLMKLAQNPRVPVPLRRQLEEYLQCSKYYGGFVPHHALRQWSSYLHAFKSRS